MKRFILPALTVIAVAVSPMAAGATSFTYEGVEYNIISEDNHTCEVGKNTDKIEGDLVIPSVVTYGGTEYTVTAIGAEAFALDTKLTSLTIPETVTKICYGAIMKTFIPALVIPDNVTEIEERGVFGNWKLMSLQISKNVRQIRHETFSGNLRLEEIVIPDGVEVIENEAFNFCSGAVKLTLGSTVKSIGKMAFAGCSKVTEVTIPASVNDLGEEAFSYCNKLATVTFEAGETPISIGINAFGQGLYAGNQFDDPTAPIVTLSLNRQWTCASTEINELPFAKKFRMETVNIGPRVTSLPANTFAKCDLIKAVNVSSEECPAAEASCFTETVYSKATLTVPRNAVETYRAHGVWGKFVNIEAEPNSVNPNDFAVALDAETIEIAEEETATITATVSKPEDVAVSTEEWSSSDEAVATVDGGTVTAVAEGMATITYTVTFENGETRSASCEVTVTKKAGIEAISAANVGEAEYFTLQGVRVEAGRLSQGIYILRHSDGTAKKVAVK